MDKSNLLCSYVVRNGKTDMKQSFADATEIIEGLKNGMSVDELFKISNKNGKPLALVGKDAVDWIKHQLFGDRTVVCEALTGNRVVLDKEVLINIHKKKVNRPFVDFIIVEASTKNADSISNLTKIDNLLKLVNTGQETPDKKTELLLKVKRMSKIVEKNCEYIISLLTNKSEEYYMSSQNYDIILSSLSDANEYRDEIKQRGGRRSKTRKNSKKSKSKKTASKRKSKKSSKKN